MIFHIIFALYHKPLSALEPRPFVILAGLSPTKNENRNQRTTRYAFSVSFVSITVFFALYDIFLSFYLSSGRIGPLYNYMYYTYIYKPIRPKMLPIRPIRCQKKIVMHHHVSFTCFPPVTIFHALTASYTSSLLPCMPLPVARDHAHATACYT